ncbi:PmoA family protein [Streptomyces hoynatensis]|uniref:Oxidoreductase n=1 Tax=Streptomyces hoynatensis TaxID=1141874 RepID=A0A3A9Z294_9ACTN|nr:PmoA family protein [Streptomyces hoynatensis]RKN42368.1 oxidoreductase [Streptomyces hoynatensis]
MTAQLSVVHAHGERIVVSAGDVEILSYVYRPDPEPFESRKPYAHPLRTLSGHLVSGYRPNDHRWHKGLQMTASHLSEQNFWGGNSYLHGQGYQRIPERVGWMRHDGFTRVEAAGERAEFAEELTWINHGGQEWARELRTLAVHSAEPAEGAWALDWSIRLTNVRGEPLHFGSPTTAGREMAGYTGLQWRGPRDFTGGQVLLPSGPIADQEAMGTPAAEAPWLGFVAEHDDVDAHSTLLFVHAPENAGEAAIHPSHWFVRSSPIPTVAFSWAFFEEFELAPGESFAYRYRVVVADGAWDGARVESYLKSHAW